MSVSILNNLNSSILFKLLKTGIIRISLFKFGNKFNIVAKYSPKFYCKSNVDSVTPLYNAFVNITAIMNEKRYIMCFTTVFSFIYYNDFIYYNNNKFIWAMTKFCLNNFVNLWCMDWLYCVYKISAYDIINSYSGIICLVFCWFFIL